MKFETARLLVSMILFAPVMLLLALIADTIRYALRRDWKMLRRYWRETPRTVQALYRYFTVQLGGKR